MTVGDFSFPVPATTIDSPRMWRSLEEKTTTKEDQAGHETTTRTTTKKRVIDISQRSFSCIETCNRDEFIISGFNDDRGEKMDLLWESFNEELPRSQSSRVAAADSDIDRRSQVCHDGDGDQQVELGCVKAMKLSKTRTCGNSNNNNHSKTAMVLVLRILKKLFTIHHSAHHHHHHHHHHLNHHHQNKLKAAHAW